MGSARAAGVIFIACFLAACAEFTPTPEIETVYTISPATLFEDGFGTYDISPTGEGALYRAFSGVRAIDLVHGREDAESVRGDLDDVMLAVFDRQGGLARFGRRGEQMGWFAEDPQGAQPLPFPPGFGVPSWSPDGIMLAYNMGRELWLGAPEELRPVQFGGSVTGMGWTPAGAGFYALVARPGGSSALVHVSRDGETYTVRRDLDGPPPITQLDRVAVSPDGQIVYMTLVSDSAPDHEARHQPDADRDTDIYALDLATGQLRVAVDDGGDDMAPVILGDHLYWTHNEMRDQIVVAPIEGGETRILVEEGQIPYWSHDGKRLAYTVGGWRIADWGLNLDAAVVDLDADVRPRGAPQEIVGGYHEDFTPVWSPDGRWIAYHSHRSPHAVPSYSAEGSTDDIYLRSTADPSEEIRLTDFGHEVGNPDWAPDSRRLVFSSLDRNSVSLEWIVHIDSATGQPARIERLPTPAGSPGFRTHSWSPTAEEIAVSYPLSGTRHALAVVSTTGDSLATLTEFEASTVGGLDWTPDGRTIVFSALHEGRMQLFAIARDGGEPRLLTRDPESLILPQVSPDSRWIAATRIVRLKELRRARLP